MQHAPGRGPHGFPAATVLGYPRIGRHRELSRALAQYQTGALSRGGLQTEADGIRRATRERLRHLGFPADDASIPESFPILDTVLEAAVAVGAIPERFRDVIDPHADTWAASFALARGTATAEPLESAAWFGTHYRHYVPVIGPTTTFAANGRQLVRDVRESAASGVITRPVLLGPVSLLRLSAADVGSPPDFDPLARLDDLIPVYAQLLGELREAGALWVQLDEPALVAAGASERELSAAAAVYASLGAVGERPQLFVSTAYGAIGDALATMASTSVDAIGVDLVSGTLPSRIDSLTRSRLAEKTVVAGVIDGRSVWRGDLDAALSAAADVRRLTRSVAVSTSSSLVHVPHDVALETDLDPRIAGWLAFADQKAAQVRTVAHGLTCGSASVDSARHAASAALIDRASAPGVRSLAVRERVDALTELDSVRTPRAERRIVQRARLGLPTLPTTTIGAFPQTDETRKARARYQSGIDSAEKYVAAMKTSIADVIAHQERLGFDVLVHGEAERVDMVTYFAENLDGFELTQHGWVQTLGGQCSRPPILWGDVSRRGPITVGWSRYAQSLTTAPVKGMLTGPATLLSLSFVRDDQALGDTAAQVALALRDEIADLERAGLAIIQIDEPALHGFLADDDARPKRAWALRAFRLATAGALPQTQVHAHVCTSDSGTVAAALATLDADVTSFEAARSGTTVVGDGVLPTGAGEIAPGLYDVRSSRVPDVAELEVRLRRALQHVEGRDLWVSPDCGLSAREYAEVMPSLRNVIEAARNVRVQLAMENEGDAAWPAH